jgi:hypothetical protein
LPAHVKRATELTPSSPEVATSDSPDASGGGILKKVPSRLSFRENIHSEENISKLDERLKSGASEMSDDDDDDVGDDDDDDAPVGMHKGKDKEVSTRKKVSPIKAFGGGAMIEKVSSKSHGTPLLKRSTSQSPARKRSGSAAENPNKSNGSPSKARGAKGSKVKEMSEGELMVCVCVCVFGVFVCYISL